MGEYSVISKLKLKASEVKVPSFHDAEFTGGNYTNLKLHQKEGRKKRRRSRMFQDQGQA